MVRVYDRINIYIRSEVLYEKRTTDIIFIIIGAFLFALGVNLFVIPNEFGEGGVTGITIITYYLFEWSPGLVNLILNAILLIVGYKFLNKITTIYTLIAVVTNSLFLHLTEGWTIASDEMLVNAIFGGIFIGCGLVSSFALVERQQVLPS